MKKHTQTTVGIALGAGGVRGLAHIGVLKEFDRNAIPIDAIAGSSIGALIGALYCYFGNAKEVEQLFMEQADFRHFWGIVDPSFKTGMIAGNKLLLRIREILGSTHIEDLKIPLTVIATDFLTGEEIRISKGRIAQAIRASIAIPPVIEPVRFGRMVLADGGLSNPVPDDAVRAMGIDKVIAVSLDSHFKVRRNRKKHFTDTSFRALAILRHHFAMRTTRTADLLLEPRVPVDALVGLREFFGKEIIKKNIREGAAETRRHLDEIRQLMK